MKMSEGDDKIFDRGNNIARRSPPFKRQHLAFVSDKNEDDEDEDEFPQTIEGFGYKFNEFGQLRHIQTGHPYKFEERADDHDYNQRRYEVLGNLVTQYVYDLVIQEGKMKRTVIPIDASNSEPSTFILHTENVFKTSDKLVILIHGSGVVRAGQWARRLIINDCLNSGTQLPFVKRAKGLGYEVVILNTNDNVREGKGSIRGSETPEKHSSYVWRHLVMNSPAKYVAIIAHSYGGVVTINLANSFPRQFQERVFAIAFTDSPHSLAMQGTSPHMVRWLQKVARNWISSSEPLDTPLSRGDTREIPCVSAGHQRHDMTSWSSFASIFEFLDKKYRESTIPVLSRTEHNEERYDL